MPDTATPVLSRGRRDARLTQLIMTVFAVYARPEGNWLSIAAVVALMADLGNDHQAVRSAISRLKRRGAIDSEKREGVAGYALSAGTIDILARGDVRIFQQTRAALADGWLLAIFSVPESERAKRHELRVALSRLGFGTAAPGVWIAPATLVTETRHTLDRQALAGYVDLFVGDYATTRDLRTEIKTWWDLDELARLYADFLQVFRPALRAARSRQLTPQEAFRAYVPMLTEWRRLPYRDPGLPLDLLPSSWRGKAAWALFDELNGILRPLARRHVASVLHARR